MIDCHLCEITKARIDFINTTDNIDSEFSSISNTISKAVEECFSLKSFEITAKRINKPWIIQELLELMREKTKVNQEVLKEPITMRAQYRTFRNRFNNMLKEAKQQHYITKFATSVDNGKQIWKVINEVSNNNDEHSKIDYINVNNTKVNDLHAISNHMNTYFINMGHDLARKIPHYNIFPVFSN